MQSLSIQEIIDLLHLVPLPLEGGYFSPSYKSIEMIPRVALPPRYPSSRACGTAIYYLMTPHPQGFSALHSLRTDEILHFYLGDPVDTLLLFPDGHSLHLTLGQDLLHDQILQLVVPAGVWQGHRMQSGGHFALIGSTMAPGYEDEDFTLGDRSHLTGLYPQEAQWIHRLTRT